MSSIIGALPRRLSRLPFNAGTVGLVALVIFIGTVMAKESVEFGLKPLVVVAIGIHLWMILRRHDDMVTNAKTGRIYAWILSVLAVFLVLMSLRLSSTSVEGFNYALLGYYLIFLVLVVPVMLSCALRRSSMPEDGYELGESLGHASRDGNGIKTSLNSGESLLIE